MKKIDSFFLSDKQIDNMKNMKKPNKKLANFAVTMLASTASLLLASHAPEILQGFGISELGMETIETLLTGIGSLSAIVGVVKFLKREPSVYSSNKFDSATQQRISELTSSDYYPDDFWETYDKDDEQSRKSK